MLKSSVINGQLIQTETLSQFYQRTNEVLPDESSLERGHGHFFVKLSGNLPEKHRTIAGTIIRSA